MEKSYLKNVSLGLVVGLYKMVKLKPFERLTNLELSKMLKYRPEFLRPKDKASQNIFYGKVQNNWKNQ